MTLRSLALLGLALPSTCLAANPGRFTITQLELMVHGLAADGQRRWAAGLARKSPVFTDPTVSVGISA